MSSWRIVLRALNEAGGTARAADLELTTGGLDARSGLYEAAKLGLVKSGGRGGFCKGGKPWQMTELGRAYCEGRAELKSVPRRPGTIGAIKKMVCASWLESLPRGVRIEQAARCRCFQKAPSEEIEEPA